LVLVGGASTSFFLQTFDILHMIEPNNLHHKIKRASNT
jgi:hypothetical protein